MPTPVKFTATVATVLACILISACATTQQPQPEPPAASSDAGQQTAPVQTNPQADLENEQRRRQEVLVNELRSSPHFSVMEGENGEIVIQIRSTDAFGRSRATLSPSLKQTLEHVARVVQPYDNLLVLTIGHTDSTGSPEQNLALSTARAAAAAKYLVEVGLDGSRVQYDGRGAAEPIASNDTREGRAVNRRVDILIRPNS